MKIIQMVVNEKQEKKIDITIKTMKGSGKNDIHSFTSGSYNRTYLGFNKKDATKDFIERIL